MDDTGDGAGYAPGSYGMNKGYGSLHRRKLPNSCYSLTVGNQYVDDEDEDDEEIDEEEDDEGNNVQQMAKSEDEDDDVDDDDGDDEKQGAASADPERLRKKRKLKSLLSSYEFAPRVAVTSAGASGPKPSIGGRNSLADWTEHETLVLLDAWGERFLQRGRKSLRSEEWQEVSEKVSQESKIDRTDSQCRNRLDTLKKKYKKEKTKLTELRGATSKWVYFKKMDMLMSSSTKQAGLTCGLDSGEYVFMSPTVYLNSANGLDEMRDSPGNAELAEEDSDGLPPKKTRVDGYRDTGASFKLLADSIHKFSEIYEKTENSKRQQMLELEKMRMDFHRELELQKKQILERAQAEIAKIRQGGDEDNDVSAENISG